MKKKGCRTLLCSVLWGPGAWPLPVSARGQLPWALVMLVHCGSDASFGKGSEPPSCSQGTETSRIFPGRQGCSQVTVS